MRIIDLEWGWRFMHEDLALNSGGIVAGMGSTNTNHGTAVLGEYSGDRNAFGVTGICPDATASGVAFSMPTAEAIRNAADRLRPGDIILLEIHRPGPETTSSARRSGRLHCDRVVAGRLPGDSLRDRPGNHRRRSGRQRRGDLDDADLRHDPSRRGFPSWWRNPFDATRSTPAPL